MPTNQIEPGITLGGRYRVERRAGEGGMAVVYEARDLKHERSVAVKVLRPELASTLGIDRFLREIRITANLTHPHLLPVHDSGQWRGDLYYVMPFYAGETLRERLDRVGTLAPDAVVSVLRDILDALGHAHDEGVLHRDIKPSNVLLQGRHAMVSDFGIAKALSKATVANEVTAIGAVIGTPKYMAPEQAAGEPDVDHRADIYAIGAMAYELFTGTPPFAGGTAMSVLRRHITEAPAPIEERAPEVPEFLAEAVMRSLEKDPSDRFASAHEFRAAISAPLSVAVGERVSRRRTRSLVRRRTVAAAAGLGALVAVGLASNASPTGAELTPERAVVDQFENQTGDPAFEPVGAMLQDWLTEGLLGSGLVEVVPTLTARRASHFVRMEATAGRIRDPLGALSRETGATLVVSGSVYLAGDRLRVQAAIISASDGRSIATMPPVEGSADSVSVLLDNVRERLLGALGTSFDRRLVEQVGVAGSAPRFDAYSLLNEGLEYYESRDYDDASGRFLRAFELDPGYVVPLLYASLSLRNHGEWARSDSVVRILEQRREELAEHQGLWVDYSRAVLEGDLDRARIVIRRVAESAPGSKASYNWALTALRVGRPLEAREAMASLDPDRGAMRDDPRYWMRLADASHQLGEYQRELEEVDMLATRHPDDRSVLRHRLRALAAAGRGPDVVGVLETESVGRLPAATLARRYRQAAVELSIHGFAMEARDVARVGVAWIEAHQESGQHGLDFTVGVDGTARYPQLLYQKARLLEVLGDASEALVIYRALYAADPESWWLPGQIGMVSAWLGDEAAASEADDWLARATPPYGTSTVTSWRAGIAARLGDTDRAVTLLKQARREGQFWGSTHGWFHLNDALRTEIAFERFMAPHG